MHSILEGNNFATAVREYFWLLNREYPEKRSRRLVADRYGLNRHQRTALYRGIFPDRVNRRRIEQSLLPDEADGTALTVDLLNQLLLIMNYLYGRNVFIATDRFLRDDGENFSSFDSREFLLESLRIIGAALHTLKFTRIVFCIDASREASYRELLRSPLRLLNQIHAGLTGIEIVYPDSADRYLIEMPEVTVATSDSDVLDRCKKKVFDLAGYALVRRFSPHLPDLHTIVYENSKS